MFAVLRHGLYFSFRGAGTASAAGAAAMNNLNRTKDAIERLEMRGKKCDPPTAKPPRAMPRVLSRRPLADWRFLIVWTRVACHKFEA